MTSDQQERKAIAEASGDVAKLSSMHMAHVLAGVTGRILERLPEGLRQTLFDMICTSASESVEHVIGYHPGSLKQQVRSLTRVYVWVALKQVATDLSLEVRTFAPPGGAKAGSATDPS
jgi:hypothetical protein